MTCSTEDHLVYVLKRTGVHSESLNKSEEMGPGAWGATWANHIMV